MTRPYLSLTDRDRREMLAAIGVASVEELFRDVPAGVRLGRELALEPPLSEPELVSHLEGLAARNAPASAELSFLGAGVYDHYVPAIVDAVLARGELLTAYTPYQPELSQGVLQAIFEYQTAICELTGMGVANASGYDGCTVAADACYVAKHATGRSKVVVCETLAPQVRQVVRTYAVGFGLDVVEVPHRGGTTDPGELAAACEGAACAIFQQPNFLGCLEPAPELAAAAAGAGALPVAHVDLLTLGVLEAPGAYGCALAIGEGQGAGNFLSYGGPHFGFLASRWELARRLPGRIAGETVDGAGRRGYVLTLQTREQHIRREKATSNITTNQTLCALAGLVHLAWLGPGGLAELGETCLALAAYARERLPRGRGPPPLPPPRRPRVTPRGPPPPPPGHALPRVEVPAALRRVDPPRLPELAEPELLRHFTALSARNFGVDTGFYPLGSCTMKHNPRVNERVAALPGFRDLHPHQEIDGCQGALELMWRLQEILGEISGLDAVTLQPAAGSQGELLGLLLVRAYFAERGEERSEVIVPDTAHGTNPASVTMAGYTLVPVATDLRGNVDLADLRGKVSERTAALMLTNPSTLGLFDEGVLEITGSVHEAGGLCYYDGANLNAVCGISRPGDMGFDVVHINLHKTFSTPHGGGGPGGGPIAVRALLEPYLPVPVVVRREDGSFDLDSERPRSIGKVRGFAGPFGVLVRAYAFIRTYGPALREMSETAVLNANYLLAHLRGAYELPYDRLCMHEFVLSARELKREHGVSALDVAKRLMDYGFHPPTIYFPLVVPEALMIEPTETEAKETLDAFCEAMLAIAREAAEEPELLEEAPHTCPVGRLDEVRAVREPVVRYLFEAHPSRE